jgi:hypothetical protein
MLSSFLHVCWRHLRRQGLRRLWPPLPAHRQHILACVWLDDDQHLQDVLSDPVEPSSLLRHRRLARFQSCVFKCMPSLSDARNVAQLNRGFLGIDMVSQEARRRTRHRCRWLISRRCNLPSPDHQSAPSSRLRLDHSLLCLPDPGALAVCKLCSHKPYQASETLHGICDIRPAPARAGLCLMDCCSHFLLLCAGQTPPHRTRH